MKLQLMQEIASEFSIEWNSKALEQKLYKPPATEQVSFLASFMSILWHLQDTCEDIDIFSLQIGSFAGLIHEWL